jgi:hypothetical protein
MSLYRSFLPSWPVVVIESMLILGDVICLGKSEQIWLYFLRTGMQETFYWRLHHSSSENIQSRSWSLNQRRIRDGCSGFMIAPDPDPIRSSLSVRSCVKMGIRGFQLTYSVYFHTKGHDCKWRCSLKLYCISKILSAECIKKSTTKLAQA